MKFSLAFLVLGLCHHALANQAEEESDLFEGDMILNPDQKAEIELDAAGIPTYGATHGKNYPKWPTSIPYEISGELARESKAVQAINDAIKDYHTYSCLRFRRRRSDRNYIKFVNPTGNRGCSSPVAMQGVNNIKLASGCWQKGTVIHEILHSLGFFHEQSRPDRDNHVTIVWANIPNDKRHNFKKYTASRINSLRSPYDYDSIMHYGRTAFGSGKVTIQTKNPKYACRVGQRDGFSQEDVFQLNSKYCPGSRIPTVPKPPCVNKQNDRTCDSWKRKGYCVCGSQYYRFVKKECRKTCGCA